MMCAASTKGTEVLNQIGENMQDLMNHYHFQLTFAPNYDTLQIQTKCVLVMSDTNKQCLKLTLNHFCFYPLHTAKEKRSKRNRRFIQQEYSCNTKHSQIVFLLHHQQFSRHVFKGCKQNSSKTRNNKYIEQSLSYHGGIRKAPCKDYT